jgi:GT2 family glycosyltransferase
MALRRETWRAVGPLDEGYRFYGQDLDLCLAARDAGWRVEVVRGFVVTHHHGATISSSAGTAAPYHPANMWSDLVRFVAKRRGAGAGRRAAAAIRAGARLRLAGRRFLQPFIAGDRRADWRVETASFVAGLESLRASPDS